MNKYIWILLYYVNEYDQEGGYFAGAFETREQGVITVDHLGRKDFEHSWYELDKVEINTLQEPE